MILATKDHVASEEDNINFFTDADLSILGSNQSVYTEYCQCIRKEFAALPDFIYTVGRKKLLQQFLKMTAVFKTERFYRKYEKTAKKNIRYEFDTL